MAFRGNDASKPRVEGDVRADGRVPRRVVVAELHVRDACARADPHPRHDRVIGFEADLLAQIALIEVRVDLPVHPERRAGPRALIVERPFELHAGAPLAAPRERKRQPAIVPGDVSERRADAVRQSVAVGVLDDRKPLHRAAELRAEAGREVVALIPARSSMTIITRMSEGSSIDRYRLRTSTLSKRWLVRSACCASASLASLAGSPTLRPLRPRTSASGVV
jgi:hypothetical protein